MPGTGFPRSQVKPIEPPAQRNKPRYAFEWFMREQDKFYYNLNQERIRRFDEKNKGQHQKITALAVTSAVVGTASFILASFAFLLRKSR